MNKNLRCASYDRKNLFDDHPADEIRDAAKKSRDRIRDPQIGATFVAKVKNESQFLKGYFRTGVDLNL
ncbi:hypothetical protein KBC59_01335 [Patescibacteria group bacterium]|jgi:hypothetical protein|nr:hypothetical protein [Patescibacteria group bacterium]